MIVDFGRVYRTSAQWEGNPAVPCGCGMASIEMASIFISATEVRIAHAGVIAVDKA